MALKILLVEDDPVVQNYAQTVLQQAGFAVDATDSAREARGQLKAGLPSLVVCDIGLPDGNGLDLCRELKGRGVPVLFLTGRSDLKTRLDAFSAGAYDYIQKPFAGEELLARVKVHLELKKSHDELAKRAQDLEIINRARQDMTDMIVHDLRTPLSSIKGTVELIKTRGLISDTAHRTLLDNAGSAADFMLLMLNDLLDIGQAEQKGITAQSEDVDCAVLLEKLRLLFEARFKQLKLNCAMRVEGDSKTLRSDFNLLFRVLVNLLSNAVTHSPRGGEIEVEISRRDGAARLSVADRGPGVPDADKTHIFEKYATTGGADRLSSGSGHGIGLAFCRLAAYALRGKIWVEDRPGGGSLFVLALKQ